MLALILPFLAPLLTKLPSLATLKWIAGGILIVLIGLTGFALGYHWEESAFADYKANAAIAQKRIQDHYDEIGREAAAKYEAQREASEAETQRQLQELRSGPKQLGRGDGGVRRGMDATRGRLGRVGDRGGDDSARIIGVLRSAAGK